MLERVVLAYDFSEACDDALAWCVDLARAVHGRVHLVHVTDRAEGDDDPALNTLRKDLALAADEAGPEVLSHVLVGSDVAKAVVHFAEEVNADAVVIATRGARGVARMLLGSVADEVILRATCPVITLRATDD